jgi:hypothetical protein
MSTIQQRDHQKEVEQHQREILKTFIGEQVMDALGRPGDLLQVQVRLLWNNHYRVNVLVGVDAASATVANSFFLGVGSDGIITMSAPMITKQY